MVEDRLTRWVRASYALARFEHFMPVVAQMLGRLDCHLIAEDGRFVNLSTEERDTIPEALRATDRFTLSYLWVLGAYEIVRSVGQRLRGTTLLGADLIEKVSQTKKLLARLRMPLAKMEPANAHRSTDGMVAYPAQHPSLGTAWLIAPDVLISRRELSDAVLSMLERLREADPALPAPPPDAV